MPKVEKVEITFDNGEKYELPLYESITNFEVQQHSGSKEEIGEGTNIKEYRPNGNNVLCILSTPKKMMNEISVDISRIIRRAIDN